VRYKLKKAMMIKLQKLSDMADEVRNELDEVHSDAESRFYDRDEYWQESDRGQEVMGWIEKLQELSYTVGEMADLEVDEYEMPE